MTIISSKKKDFRIDIHREVSDMRTSDLTCRLSQMQSYEKIFSYVCNYWYGISTERINPSIRKWKPMLRKFRACNL